MLFVNELSMGPGLGGKHKKKLIEYKLVHQMNQLMLLEMHQMPLLERNPKERHLLGGYTSHKVSQLEMVAILLLAFTVGLS